jgi:hypothetical protein
MEKATIKAPESAKDFKGRSVGRGNTVKADAKGYFMTNVAAYEDTTKAIIMGGLTKEGDASVPLITNVAQAEQFKTWINEGLEKFDADRGHKIVEAAEGRKTSNVLDMKKGRSIGC